MRKHILRRIANRDKHSYIRIYMSVESSWKYIKYDTELQLAPSYWQAVHVTQLQISEHKHVNRPESNPLKVIEIYSHI